MINIYLLNKLNLFYFNFKNKISNIYKNSNFYEKKISKTYNNNFEYKPSPHLLSSIIKYQKKKYKVEDFALDSIWQNNNKSKDFDKLNNFFWFFSLDLKSSKKIVQTLIYKWISNNYKHNDKTWDFDLTSKRIISWLSNHQLTYEGGDNEYIVKFNFFIQKQTNHIINEINSDKKYRSVEVDYKSFSNDLSDEKEKLNFSDLELIFKDLKSLFEKRGFIINWKALEKQSLDETINALAMASPFSLEEKQILLEAKSLDIRKNKIAEILKTYIFDNYENTTLQ